MTLDDLHAAFELADDWEERYAILIDVGRKRAGLPESEQVEANIVRGCMSQVWMVAAVDDAGRLRVAADSDALIVRGLITTRQRLTARLNRQLEAIPEIIALHAISGEFDLIIEVAAESPEGLNHVLDQVGALEGIERTQTSVILETRFSR